MTAEQSTRYIPTPEEAEGMRAGIIAQRARQGLLDDPSKHPFHRLDFSTPTDRKVIAAVYADMVRHP